MRLHSRRGCKSPVETMRVHLSSGQECTLVDCCNHRELCVGEKNTCICARDTCYGLIEGTVAQLLFFFFFRVAGSHSREIPPSLAVVQLSCVFDVAT